jgi:choline dehydrogenase
VASYIIAAEHAEGQSVSKTTRYSVPALSPGRRRFLSGLLRCGFSVAAASALSEVAFAGGGKVVKPVPGAYDYIIVGAGSAGCVLADRLSAAGFSVLVIEAGSADITQPKIADARHWLENFGSDTDWQIPVAPQPALNGQSFTISSGLVAGGSGSTNGMGWLRPDVRDLAVINRLLGPRWSIENLYAGLARAERFVTGNSVGRSLDGKMTVGRYSPANPLSTAIIQAAGEISTPVPSIDLNASRLTEGIGYSDMNCEPDGLRSGPAETYLADAVARSNVDLIAGTLVTKLVIEGDVCTGVECVVNGSIERFYASRDVVLSAGTLATPKLLMLSGIGPERDLRQLDIRRLHHLPAVGANFQEQLTVFTVYSGGPAYVAGTMGLDVGPITLVPNGDSTSSPDISVVNFMKPFPPGVVPGERGFTFISRNAKPRSRGRIITQSNDPRVPALADPAFLSDPRDLSATLAAFELSLAIPAAPALRPFVDQPFFDAAALATTEGKLQFIQENGRVTFHPTSSCVAGTDPAHSVVDSALKVWGIRNLRVVDGSVLPEMPGLALHTMVIGVAEVASQIILEGH